MEVGAEGRSSTSDLIRLLTERYAEFDFFQAVRLLQSALMLEVDSRYRRSIGMDALFQNERIRFRSFQSLTFPSTEISRIRQLDDDDNPSAEVTATFMGLTGPNGVLPPHYTSLVIERSHVQNKDYSLRDFFDLFNHRALSFFFQASEKHRLPFVYERSQFIEHRENAITTSLRAVTGIAGPGLKDRSSFHDEVILYFGGLFADRCRSAAGLKQLLQAYFQSDVDVEQMCERWMYLPSECLSSFVVGNSMLGGNMQLGANVVAGSRMREIQSLFRVIFRLMTWKQFLTFLPGSDGHQQVTELVHHYAGIDLDFELEFSIPSEEVCPMSLNRSDESKPMLGWTTWLGKPPENTRVNDARFRYGYGGMPFSN
ncbi:type VI secretion system baseplate subunit TssG [Thalassoglobus sp. JC818]|uniref:type VI secretion system baseplate subunit TssG n=1 Tax=Thalassoglobus sp. JC818 TaxID=3232136 RepID=UPI00345801FB